MLANILFIEIFQPFAQYRNPFTFYYAQTYPLPPKSTIIGMLQNALGDWYGNEYGIEKWYKLKVSVHGGFESVFWNYQSLIKGEITIKEGKLMNKPENEYLPLYGEYKTSQRSPVYQQELFNGHLYIFIRDDEGNLIKKIKEALEKPSKILYLGRSEDVVFIKTVKEIEIKNDKIEGDIKLTYPTYLLLNRLPIKNQKYPVYSIPTKIIFRNNNTNVKHKSEINNNTTEREVKFEQVIYTGYDYSIIFKEDVPIELQYVNINDKENNKEITILESGWL